jgi:hypothetical protein
MKYNVNEHKRMLEQHKISLPSEFYATERAVNELVTNPQFHKAIAKLLLTPPDKRVWKQVMDIRKQYGILAHTFNLAVHALYGCRLKRQENLAVISEFFNPFTV